ncbi:hypothetical protein Cob_v003675 [Colletotrichum orbiculare MAFF 240422]|uniref:Uncharacterized protein n=1 Tax=Colletotrichum orbiculare (strain 104-T / ATCC 96160 / CBS 514.97 / LARS 414 / MAFF 240422) TaxID=1213857 RepID=A0A484FZG6_COLOR|nr:hypothetical protein Cob_v003675 [Colletotrichum orbiculare MAFF 240422]
MRPSCSRHRGTSHTFPRLDGHSALTPPFLDDRQDSRTTSFKERHGQAIRMSSRNGLWLMPCTRAEDGKCLAAFTKRLRGGIARDTKGRCLYLWSIVLEV